MSEGEGIFREHLEGRIEAGEEDVKDERLFFACRDGQKDACAEFHIKWHTKITEQVTAMGADRVGLDIDKIAGRILDRLMYQPISVYDRSKGAKFSSWLYQIVRNQFITEIESHQSARRHDREVEESLGRRQSTPEELHLRKEVEERIAEAIAALPEEQRMAFVLFELEHIPYQEIATREGIPIGTVGKRIKLARKKLQRVLGPLYKEFKESR